MQREVELRHLRSFVTVAECLSFRTAARLLGVTPSPLSRTIRELEEALGCRLFRRSTRTVLLTPEGQDLHQRLRGLLALLEGELGVRPSLDPKDRPLVVGFRPSSLVAVVRRVLQGFSALDPSVRIQLHLYDWSEVVGALRSGRLDAAFVVSRLAADDIEFEPLEGVPAVACVSRDHPLAGRTRVRVRDLRPTPLIRFHPPAWKPRSEVSLLEPSATTVGIEAADGRALRDAVAQGGGVAIVPATSAHAYRHAGVSYVELEDAESFEIGLAYTREALRSPHLRSLREAVAITAREVALSGTGRRGGGQR